MNAKDKKLLGKAFLIALSVVLGTILSIALGAFCVYVDTTILHNAFYTCLAGYLTLIATVGIAIIVYFGLKY